jgi:hypothetical protein
MSLTVIKPRQTLTVIQPPAGPSVSLLSTRAELTVINIAQRGRDGVAEAYGHNQPSAASEWTINHNLGYRPSVTLYSIGGAEIDAEVIHISVNQARAYFATNVAGSARCI